MLFSSFELCLLSLQRATAKLPRRQDDESDGDSSSSDSSIDEKAKSVEPQQIVQQSRPETPPAVEENALRQRMSALGLDGASPHSTELIIGLVSRNTTRTINRLVGTRKNRSKNLVNNYTATEVDCSALELYEHVRDHLPIQPEFDVADGDISQTNWCTTNDGALIPMESNNLRNMLREDTDVSVQVCGFGFL